MAATVKELIDVLKQRDELELIEFIVVKEDGKMIAVNMQKHAGPVINVLKKFGAIDG